MMAWRSNYSRHSCNRCGNRILNLFRQQVDSFHSMINAKRCKFRILTRYKSKVPKKEEHVIPDIPFNPVLPPKGVRSSNSKNKWRLVMIVIPITTFCLGTWQVFRLQWKVDLIADLERKTRLPPVEIPANILDNVESLEYSRVSLTGHFNHSKELYMWPRTLTTSTDPLVHNNTTPGAYVVTPFYCNELGNWILVNRGWVPKRSMNPKTRKKGQVKGDVKLTAVVRAPEEKSMFAPENDPAANHWNYKDVVAMAAHAGTLPLYLDADATTTVRGGPIGGQTRITLRNEHLQYVFTWYTLALATSYLFYKFWTKGRG